MADRIGDRLREARRRNVVGRRAELSQFVAALDAEAPPFFVLNVYGPGGIGKSTMLQRMRDLCAERAISCVALNAQEIAATPESFLEALAPALPGLRESERRQVLTIDHYEEIAALEGWLREVFLPTLSGETIVVLAGRKPVSAAWRGDPSWQGLIQALSLRNLSPEDSRLFLTGRGVPERHHKGIVATTHGYPLALSLVGDLWTQRGALPESAGEGDVLSPDIVTTLLERLVEKTPTPDHRAALEVCALLRLTTVPLLARLLDTDQAESLFEWLRGLSFLEAAPHGLAPHGVAREALLADLRWRRPDRYADWHRKARMYYTERLATSEPREQQRILWDYMFLHRDNAIIREAFTWQEGAAAYADVARPADLAPLTEMVRLHEGDDSASIFTYWSERPDRQQILVFRAPGTDAPAGFMMAISLEKTDAADASADPAIAAARRFVEREGGFKPGHVVTYFRFWMAADTYQEVSPIQSMIVVNCVRHYLTMPNLARSFFPCALPEVYAPVFAYAELASCPATDFTVGEKKYSGFSYDWKTLPPLAWLAVLADKETQMLAPSTAATAGTPLQFTLSREAFAEAIRDALKCFDRSERLTGNPLVRSRLVEDRAGQGATLTTRVAALRGVLREAIESLHGSVRRERAFSALDRTFLRPAATQEKAAEALDLPFSTYRRHLSEGVSALIDTLWQQELEMGAK